MIHDVSKDVIKAIRALYRSNKVAQRLFQQHAARERDASYSTVEVLCRNLAIERPEAIKLCHDLDEAGCGQFVVGRRTGKSRLLWHYSCIALGKAAAGEQVELSKSDTATAEEESVPATGFSIEQAKAGLAARFGVPMAHIEITIKA
jgi:hypothetical protein